MTLFLLNSEKNALFFLRRIVTRLTQQLKSCPTMLAKRTADSTDRFQPPFQPSLKRKTKETTTTNKPTNGKHMSIQTVQAPVVQRVYRDDKSLSSG